MTSPVLPTPTVPIVTKQTGAMNDPWYRYLHQNNVSVSTQFADQQSQVTAITPVADNWIPNLEFGGANTGITYSTQIGRYFKIVNFVHVWATIVLTSKGVATGIADLSGLPFAASSLTGAMFTGSFGNYSNMQFFGTPSDGPFPHSAIYAGESVVRMFDTNGTVFGTQQIDDTWFTNTSTLSLSVSYQTG